MKEEVRRSRCECLCNRRIQKCVGYIHRLCLFSVNGTDIISWMVEEEGVKNEEAKSC